MAQWFSQLAGCSSPAIPNNSILEIPQGQPSLRGSQGKKKKMHMLISSFVIEEA